MVCLRCQTPRSETELITNDLYGNVWRCSYFSETTDQCKFPLGSVHILSVFASASVSVLVSDSLKEPLFQLHKQTFSIGQQAHAPLFIWQHVVLSGQDDPPGQGTSSTISWTTDSTFVLVNQGKDVSPWEQVAVRESHLYPWGQQWAWSLQHVA